MSFNVARRTREIRIRMALGAERRRVLVMVIRQGMLLALAALAAIWRPARRATRVDPMFGAALGVRAAGGSI